MKTLTKIVAAIVVTVLLAVALTYVTFYVLFGALILCLFYQPWVYFILGTLFAGFCLWIGLKIFRHPPIYRLQR